MDVEEEGASEGIHVRVRVPEGLAPGKTSKQAAQFKRRERAR